MRTINFKPDPAFRTFEEAREALWGEPGEPLHLRRVAWLWAFSDRLYPMWVLASNTGMNRLPGWRWCADLLLYSGNSRLFCGMYLHPTCGPR